MGEIMTTDDVAQSLGISVRRVQQLVREKRLIPLRRVRGAALFTADTVATFAAKERRSGKPPRDKGPA